MTSCSPGAESSESTADADPGTTPSESSSVLERLSGDELCELLPGSSVQRSLDVGVEGTEGVERGAVPPFLSFECDYDTTGLPAVTTRLETTEDDTTDAELLDEEFTDLVGKGRPVGDYRTLPDLGRVAGVGRDATLAGGGVNGWIIAVVVDVGDERMVLTISVTGEPKAVGLRSLAGELLANLEAATGMP